MKTTNELLNEVHKIIPGCVIEGGVEPNTYLMYSCTRELNKCNPIFTDALPLRKLLKQVLQNYKEK